MVHPSIRHVTAVALLGALATLSAASCNDEQIAAVVAALGEGCLLDSDCDADLICVFRRCHVECETTQDCRDRGEDTDCVSSDTTNVCLLPVEEPCVVDDDVGAGPRFLHATCPSEELLCARDGLCRNPCVSDGDCVTGASCAVTGVCAESDVTGDSDNPINESGEHGGVTATCIYSSECVAPLVCRDQQCREACLAAADCLEGQMCISVESPALGSSFGACRAKNGDPSLPASCQNGVLDEDESDVDCGGAVCAGCASGATCNGATDCESGICSAAGICQVPSCQDGVANANETGVDCGGPQCTPCGVGGGCYTRDDCAVGLECDAATLTCVAASCGDGLRNGDESDVDCGGSCSALCADDAFCAGATDCESGVCADGTCQPPSCSDGVANGAETSTDCGGATSGCDPCGNGAACGQGSDCQSGSCQASFCAPPSCTDGVQNGFELGVDCGGSDCAIRGQGCALGTTCNVDSDCDQTSPAGCSPSTGQCTATHTVRVTTAGAGAGRVLSSPAALNCHTTSPQVCELTVYVGQSVTLTGYPDPGSTFDGLTGGCSGQPSCSFVVSSNVNVTATFQ